MSKLLSETRILNYRGSNLKSIFCVYELGRRKKSSEY